LIIEILERKPLIVQEELARMPIDILETEEIQKVIELFCALRQKNYWRVFKWYQQAKKTMRDIISLHLDSLRIWGLSIIVRSIQKQVEISYCAKALAFHSDAEFLDFVKQTKGVLNEEGTHIVKATSHKYQEDDVFSNY
jgi:hypothetical protein